MIKNYFKNIFLSIYEICVFLTKVTIPIMIVVKILSDYGGIAFLASILEPLMYIFGIPGDTGLVWASTIIANIYVGLSVFANLPALQDITVAQATTLGLLILGFHGIFLETAVVRLAGVRLWFALGFRLLGTIITAYTFYLIVIYTGIFTMPAPIAIPPQNLSTGIADWAVGLVKFMIILYGIVTVMVIFVETLKALKITDLIVRALSPLLRFVGISKTAGEFTMIGLLMGLAFGGAFLLKEAKKGHISNRDMVLSLSLLGLTHALIEDTVLLTFIGGDFMVLLLYRTFVALVLTAGLAIFIKRCPDTIFYTLIFHKPANSTQKITK